MLHIQVQGYSHSLVHIQEDIVTTDNHSGSARVQGPIRHLGLIVGICCILFIIVSAHQMLRFATFRPRTPEVAPVDPLLEAQHQLVMEAQYREHMGREMAKFMAQRPLEAGLHQDPRVLPGALLAPLAMEA